MKSTGGAAFPCLGEENYSHEFGMTLRQFYAAKAMQGDWAAQSVESGEFTTDISSETLMKRAALYFRMADAMIAVENAEWENPDAH